ncbi:MAG: FtsX-like permease family protein [candidate division Zixibacteria bacterium]|nr:FtsX-like permease family protein [candidate division Zixibacteria bacterium]
MWLHLKLAIRNIFRNKRRTFIAGSAIGIGLAALIFSDALIIGMGNNMIASATESFMGEGQIHREGFRTSFDVEKTIVNRKQIISKLKEESVVKHFTERVESFAMITSPANLSSVMMVGVSPDTETHLSQIDEAITEGSYFSEGGKRQIIIGSKLAEILEVSLGDRVVLTTAQAHTGDLAQEMFRISGIYHFNIKEMDRGMAFIRLSKAQEMLGIDGNIHEIALRFNNSSIGRNQDHPFWQEYSGDVNDAASWSKLMPELNLMLEVSQFATYILGIILFGVVALGIINTLFMSLHERLFEFGVMRAVGTSAFQMGRLVFFEAGALAFISIIIGCIAGLIVTYIVMQTGIDYTGIEVSGVTFRHLLYPVLKVDQFIIYPSAVLILTLITGLYPSIYAAKMSPAEAMRRSL